MARPETISSAQILEAARQLFLSRGAGVSTAEIARDAGVSEGSIFRRFPTKRALFMAAMGLDAPPSWVFELAGRVGTGDVRETLIGLCAQQVEFVRERLPCVMLTWSVRGASQEHLQRLQERDSPPRRGLKTLEAYLAAEAVGGRLRAEDPELAALMLLGSIWNLVFMETIGQVEQVADPRVFAEQLVRTLWHGLAPDSTAQRDDLS